MGLTPVGYLWALLSVSATLLCCTACYLPYWIQGRLLGRVDAYFSSFRRCNYPLVSPQGSVEIVMHCARYSRWKDIPSVWWQVTTILVAVACILTIMVAVVAASSCCPGYTIDSATVRLTGALQLMAALFLCGSAAVYPLGLDNREVRDCCGSSAHAYSLGQKMFKTPTPLPDLDSRITYISYQSEQQETLNPNQQQRERYCRGNPMRNN